MIHLLLLVPLLAASDPAENSAAAAWFKPTTISVRFSTPPSRDYSAATIATASNGDMQIQSSGSSDGREFAGDLMVISGNYLLARGVELPAGAEIDALDGPALEAQTVMKLLARAMPAGPDAVKGTQAIAVSEPHDAIEVATPSASGVYAAPWHLTGAIKRETDAKLTFSLSFNFAGAPQPLAITGSWERSSAPTFVDSMPIKAYRVFQLGPTAQEIPNGYATLGDLRAYAKKKGGS